ncbi:MAG: STAS domain-containing protein [Acidimicrobiia bacterium]
MFEAEVALRGDTAVVAPIGELDLATVERFRQAASAAARQAPTVVLDLRRLSFIDSSGLHAIVDLDAQAGRLIVVRGPQAVQRVFQITTLDKRLEFVDEPP